ncbi:MAG: signal peptidase I [Prochloraceae cyanobacterium]|nr:signal peptidase I [Prochloraceae cyanobacterium]
MSNRENPVVETIKTIATAAFLAFGIRTFVAEARYIPSGSMKPTLQVYDRLIVEKLTYHFREPERGDIVVFSPTQKLRAENFEEDFIKRVIGLPGEKIEIKGGKVYVNGKPIGEKYILEPSEEPFGPVVVPEDSYLVLGDNRNGSYDSRKWGYVPRKNLIGRAAFRFWPANRVGSLYTDPIYPTLKK